VACDVIALALAWLPTMLMGDRYGRTVLESFAHVGFGIVIGVWLIRVNELHRWRVSMVRSMELSRLTRVAAILAVAMIAVGRVSHIDIKTREAVLGSVLSLLLLVSGRSSYRAWLSGARRQGRHLRDVVLIGANQEGADLVELLADHPETGLRVVGVLGTREQALASGIIALWRGTTDDAVHTLDDLHCRGAIIVATALETDQLNELVRSLQDHGVHIHLSNGVRGINFRRLRAAPLAYEPLFYLEAPSLARHQKVMKRVIDLTLGLLSLALVSPVFLVIAAAIKLSDRGPVFFRQTRVGKDGEPFTVLKFRTMVVDAERRLRELQTQNERSGPLFKMERDPRVTRVGHLLRESSLDELPQLINVIRGEMSLVGPRPALPSEVMQFDSRLRQRDRVRPGITGLWQVEARDNPSFAAYRRLDLFYVDNWSVALDMVILIATVEQVAAKFFRAVFGREGADESMLSSLPRPAITPARSVQAAAAADAGPVGKFAVR
jgi:exopolysaccharide biosynthesis polyprenyl glycosylphosphotransferase